MSPFDLVTMGRIGVDIYPLQTGVGLEDVTSFGKFPLYFYRFPKAPDLDIAPEELDFDAIRAAKIFWVTVTGLSQEPSRSATLAALEARGRSGITVLDLDYRPMFWESPEQAREWVSKALDHVTVAVGNLDECDTAVGTREPREAAKALRDRGIGLAVVKQGPKGVLAVDDSGEVEVPPVPVEVVNGLGAGTRSAARCATGCCRAGTPSGSCDSPTPPGRSWPGNSPARTPCRPRTKYCAN
jgi:sugar/nucleoside kinase (ribokinase family)